MVFYIRAHVEHDERRDQAFAGNLIYSPQLARKASGRVDASFESGCLGVDRMGQVHDGMEWGGGRGVGMALREEKQRQCQYVSHDDGSGFHQFQMLQELTFSVGRKEATRNRRTCTCGEKICRSVALLQMTTKDKGWGRLSAQFK